MSLIVKNAVKEASGNMNVASDFYDALDKKVSMLIKEAMIRAKSNGRKTIRPGDL
jgi:histone H3/H4